MTNCLSNETKVVFTNKENFINFPLIVSHSNYKKIFIDSELGSEELVGYEFEKQVDADKYEALLKQLSVDFISCKFTKLNSAPIKPVVTAELVKRLRDETGLSMMECKKALTESNGDMEIAKDLVRRAGQPRLVSITRR